MTCDWQNGVSGSLMRRIARAYDKGSGCGFGKVKEL